GGGGDGGFGGRRSERPGGTASDLLPRPSGPTGGDPTHRVPGPRARQGARMRKLRIGVIDLVARGPTRAWFARVMNANLASIMPQAVAAWCRQEGHAVAFVCYTGSEDLLRELPDQADLVFVSAFTEAAQAAYALSHPFRRRGPVTALGGPHARCSPQDALRYFDYVFGFTDRQAVRAVLQDCARHRPVGVLVSAARQPAALPGVRERWPFI